MTHKIRKTIIATIILLAAVYGSFWTFNHIHPWIGIATLISVLLYGVPKIIKLANGIVPIAAILLLFASCERVAPNYIGVLMEDYGKNGKSDFSTQKGRVNTMSPGTELFQVPLWEQRADYADKVLHLKAADNTEFNSKPIYSYKVIEKRAVDVVFDNKQLGSGDDFMKALEDNILETKIYDIMKEESRKYSTDSLMASGGSLRFEEDVQNVVRSEFEKKGLELMTFSCQLDFSDKVKAKIDTRNEVNTNISVLDQQIQEQKKRNELAALKAEENIILSKGITPQLLQQQFIERWDGKAPLYGNLLPTLFKTVQ